MVASGSKPVTLAQTGPKMIPIETCYRYLKLVRLDTRLGYSMKYPPHSPPGALSEGKIENAVVR